MTSPSARIHIGISGWRYAGWCGTFYQKGLKQADELRYAASRLQTIEINGTHYSLQSLASWRRWYDETPPGFCPRGVFNSSVRCWLRSKPV